MLGRTTPAFDPVPCCSLAMPILPPSRFFAPAERADRHGIVHVGGMLTTDWLLDAYRHGIFPWPSNDGWLAWWSPDPRGIIELDELHVSRRLERRLRSGKFTVTIDQAFEAVIDGCATAQERADETWILPEMREAYVQLHRRGVAHSVESWCDGELAGGIYGIAIGGVFAGESMFYRVTDGSKIAIAHLVAHLRERGYRLFDVQMVTPHTETLGAKYIPRREYLKRLSQVIELPVTFG